MSFEVVVGKSLWLRRRGFNSAKNPLGFGFKLASKKATIFATIDHHRTAIRLRSGVDRAPDAPGNDDRGSWNRSHAEGSTIAARSRRDRGSIGPRSWCSSTNPQGRPMKIATRRKSDAPERSTRLQWRPSD